MLSSNFRRKQNNNKILPWICLSNGDFLLRYVPKQTKAFVILCLMNKCKLDANRIQSNEVTISNTVQSINSRHYRIIECISSKWCNWYTLLVLLMNHLALFWCHFPFRLVGHNANIACDLCVCFCCGLMKFATNNNIYNWISWCSSI